MKDSFPNTDVEPNTVISRVVPDKNLKVVITADKGDYEFQIYTERAAKDATQTDLRRTYVLIELTSGARMGETWGRLDEPSMTRIFSNLLSYSEYTITKVVSDWIVTCPECGHKEKGKHYEPQPRACKSLKSSGCTLRDSKAFLGKAEITEVEECFD